ncbi:MAG: TetR/AcrR family transcriptional regulator [Saprospiraceae bacterium]|nr:TetR/AcrR family transcriptional regulator [Saprospiraceae bacterium]
MEKTLTRKDLIFKEAAGLFQSQGYVGTSMRDLATKVGLKPSSFYSHIKSKHEILETICNQSAARFLSGLEQIKNSIDDPFDQWIATVDLHISIAFENPSAITVFNDEWRHLEGDSLTYFLSQRKIYQQGVVGVIKSAILSGKMRDLDPNLVFNTMIGATRWLHFISSPGKASAERIAGQVQELLLSGLKKES